MGGGTERGGEWSERKRGKMKNRRQGCRGGKKGVRGGNEET